MVIRTQNKQMLVNFAHIEAIGVEDGNIFASVSNITMRVRLGEYSNEELALKVLDQIQDHFNFGIECWDASGVERLSLIPPFSMPSDNDGDRQRIVTIV